jgi:hypothetical protein
VAIRDCAGGAMDSWEGLLPALELVTQLHRYLGL